MSRSGPSDDGGPGILSPPAGRHPRAGAWLRRPGATGSVVAAVLALVLLAGCSKGREPFGVIPTSEGFPVAIDRIVAIDAASGLPRVKQVRVGEQVYFTVLTAPRARCKVEFVWPEEGQEPKDLPSRDAGEEGYAEWNWKVREGTAVGQTVSVTFICHRQGDPGVSNAAVDSFEVIP